jgi:hypothetical protein
VPPRGYERIVVYSQEGRIFQCIFTHNITEIEALYCLVSLTTPANMLSNSTTARKLSEYGIVRTVEDRVDDGHSRRREWTPRYQLTPWPTTTDEDIVSIVDIAKDDHDLNLPPYLCGTARRLQTEVYDTIPTTSTSKRYPSEDARVYRLWECLQLSNTAVTSVESSLGIRRCRP